jgi:hypothetical protein
VQIGKAHPQPALRLRIFDTEWDDELVAFARDCQLAMDVWVVIAAIREDQQHRPAALDGVGNLIVVRCAAGALLTAPLAPYDATV